jgi:hypothetical protein
MATMEQLIQFYGLVIQIENSYGNDTRNLRERIKLRFGEIRGMGLDRFETLWRAFNPSIEEIQQICEILRETFNLRFTVLNARVYSTTSNFMKWKEWRKQAAIGCMNYHTQ